MCSFPSRLLSAGLSWGAAPQVPRGQAGCEAAAPGAHGRAVGVGLGYLFAAQVSESTVLGALGAISMLFGLQRLWVERGGAIVLPSSSPDWMGFLFGIGSGFTSQIAHAGSPPFQMWVLPKRLPLSAHPAG